MSNLIALKDNNNDIGLGTSFISLGTNIGTSVLPFKKNDETILIDFNATNNSINLPTIESGTWQGNIISTAYGGTGLSSIGSVGQVLTVKNNETELEWTTISSSGGSIQNATNIATNVTSDVTIGNISKDLIINTSLLNINLGSTIPTNNQVLKYNNGNLSWQNMSTPNTSNLFSIMDLFHPAYILLLKSLEIKLDDVTTALDPVFNTNITNYTLSNINPNSKVKISYLLFSNKATTQINYPNSTSFDSNTEEYTLTDTSNTFNIINSSGNISKTYTIVITRPQQ